MAGWIGFECLECGKRFRTFESAEKASIDGCPVCGGVDIDIASPPDFDQVFQTLDNERSDHEDRIGLIRDYKKF